MFNGLSRAVPHPMAKVSMKTLVAVTMAALLLLGAASMALAEGDCGSHASSTKTADGGSTQDAKKGS
ncbi:MAG TPA: hypothetical protein VF678_01215 [bacterium]